MILLAIQLTSRFVTFISARMSRTWREAIGGEGRGVLKFIGDLQISCEGKMDGCYVLCDRDYCESYA